MLLYRTLRLMLKGAVSVFFVDIQSTGEEHIPETGPVIFAANHPNSIMDTVILGTRTPRQIHYMARSGLFSNPVVRFVFNRCGVIPVYRRQDDPAQSGRNMEAFQAAWDVLASGGCIGIFPEGQNAPERHVRDLKTGTARIALGAEAKHDFGLGVKVVPVGLNFEDRDRFLSRVLVSFGPAVDAATFREQWAEDEKTAARAMTEDIQDGLRHEAVHIAEIQSAQLLKSIEAIYARTLYESLFTAANDTEDYQSPLMERLREDEREKIARRPTLADKFYLKQRLGDALAWFEANDAERVDRMQSQIRRYQENLAQVRLRENFADKPPETLSMRQEGLKLSLYAVLLAPVFFWGLINNILPFFMTRGAVARIGDEAKRAFTALLVGFVAFGGFYTLQSWGVYSLTASILTTVLYAISVPFAGMFALRYRRQVARYRDRIVVRTMVLSRSALIRQLLAQRARLLDELEDMRTTFMDATMRDADAPEGSHG